MFRFYTPIVILQVFCLYHAYRYNPHPTRWYLIILFLPFLGSVIYLIDTFLTRRNLEDLSEGVKQTINSNRKIEQLEKRAKLANTISNRVELADAYVEIQRFDDAIELYNSCLRHHPASQPSIVKALVQVHFLNKNYAEVIRLGQLIENDKSFQQSEERIAYAWAWHYSEMNEKAEEQFQAMDLRYSNHKKRLEYVKFLIETQRKTEAKNKLKALLEELNDMDGFERKLKKDTLRQARGIYNGL